MARVKYSPDEVDLLARLITGEAGGEGLQGMQNAGNVMINRVVAGSDTNAQKDCTDFAGINTITKMVYQKDPGSSYHSFNAVDFPPFYGPPNPDASDVAQQVIDGLRIHPAYYSLWFEQPPKNKSCPSTFYSSTFSGQYKSLCYYDPLKGNCPAIQSH